MADITILDEQGVEVTPQETKVSLEPEATLVPDGLLLVENVAKMFDMRPNEISLNKSKLNTLIEYAKMKTDDHSASGIKWAIRNLGLKLGTPPLGEKLLPYLTRYAHLELETYKIEAEKAKYLNANNN